jgi:hypothetical protein
MLKVREGLIYFRIFIDFINTGIPTISPTRHWSSKEISRFIYGDRVDLSQLGQYTASYKNAPNGTDSGLSDDESMNIDDDADGLMTSEVLQPSHALDLLHLQVIDHFSRLLVDLVGRVGGEEVRQITKAEDEANTSQHAPRQRHYTGWSLVDCLEYLNRHRAVKVTNPRVEVFLSKPYSHLGARRGQDWSRKDWEVGLGSLKEIGTAWGDLSITESLTVLEPHLTSIFCMKLRPT